MSVNKNTFEYSSNSIRLISRQWIFVITFCIAAIILIPAIWKGLEDFSPENDYRQPYELSSDYWLYERYSKIASSEYDTLIIGDSVVWGHYVSKDNTLSHYLNELTSNNSFANLGLDGLHPAAMEGLMRYYGKAIENKNVILHLNLLWMSSALHDLQTDKESSFNHPKLVSQFSTKIPCYKASFSTRLSIALKRLITFTKWSSHLNITYFDNLDMPTWTIDNPYKNPFEIIDFNIPNEDKYEASKQIQDNQKTRSGSNFQWVDSNTSLQWKFFKQTIQLLKDRGNNIFIVIGPFNENMLDNESKEDYTKLKSEIELWLNQNNIAYYAPASLPAQLYNDASHPNAEGYEELAKYIYQNENFIINFLDNN